MAANHSSNQINDPTDDLFASLERDLLSGSSYNNSASSINNKPPPGMMGIMSSSAGAFVVNSQQQQQAIAAATTVDSNTVTLDPDDAWSAALSQFGGMSLAADFLAADTAKKQVSEDATAAVLRQTESGILGEAISSNVVDKLFEDDEDYVLEEEVVVGSSGGGQQQLGGGSGGNEEIDATGGLMALLGASRAKTTASSSATATPLAKEKSTTAPLNPEMMSPQNLVGVKAPPPSPMFPPQMNMPHGGGPMGGPMPPPPHMMHMMPPPHMQGMPPPPPHMMGMMPPPHHMQGMPPPHMMGMMPPTGPGVMMPPMGPGVGPLPPHGNDNNNNMQSGGRGPQMTKKGGKDLFGSRDFPALGATPQQVEEDDEEEEKQSESDDAEEVHTANVLPPIRTRIFFNNPDPSAPPINAQHVESALMPTRDVCYVVHSMLRPLQSLDAYNDDYYHWSFVDRKSRNMLMLGGDISKVLPKPVWKEVKVMAKEREDKFRAAVETRSKEFAEEKKSLGRMVKSNVKRPKALLNTPVLNKEKEIGEAEESKVDSDYEREQQRTRVQLWRARVAIDKGCTAFLSLVELRRLIQANVGAPQLVNELMGDVKSNVDIMHASLGVTIKTDSDGKRKVVVDKARLSSTLSLPKGRTLCARVIEGGILPHQSACEILPIALYCILSSPLPAAEGEDRLLRALTGLVLTVQPSVDPVILCSCLDMAVSVGNESDGEDVTKSKMANFTGSRSRMELLHSILSRGKAVCNEDESLSGTWSEKEKAFMALLQ